MAAILAILLVHCGSLSAQSRFTGIWEGTLDVGMELRLVFHIRDTAGNLTARMDSPDQSAFGIPCDSIAASGDSLFIGMKVIGASYRARLSADTLLTGSFTQRVTLPLQLVKVPAPTSRKRPQTPRPPFPYKVENVTYLNSDKSIRFGATLTIPKGEGPFPAIHLISGSGPQNRNGEIMGHLPFAVLADHLTRNGFMVLRTDDRGTGSSTGTFETATTNDLADDAEAGWNYLISRRETDPKRSGLLGHSEGGLIAPLVASRRRDVGFIILLAAPGVRITELMTKQAGNVMRSISISEPAIAAYEELYRKVVARVTSGSDTAEALRISGKEYERWARKQDTSVLRELELKDPIARQTASTALVRALYRPWFRHFIRIDPTPAIRKLQCKVLALNGTRDIQVDAEQNLPALEKNLKRSQSPSWKARELPGLNHLFQTCRHCTIAEYGQLEETFSAEALDILTRWLEQEVK
jgi:pimeloyl-ACP methyl ester carboxylesterase